MKQKTKTFTEFVQDYNQFYQCSFSTINCSTHDLPEIMDNLYDTDDYEIDYDEETIELFY